MTKKAFIVAILLLLLGWATPLRAQFHTEVMDAERFKTLRIRYQAQADADRVVMTERPILELRDGIIDGQDADNTLEISFDEMSHDICQFTYTVRHLSANWQPDALMSSEYLQGFPTADITDYALSLNTQRAYTHYRFSFPNSDMQLTKSGNYVLQIYEDGNEDKTIAWVTFSVVNPQVGIAAQVRAATDIELNGRYQQLDIDLQTNALPNLNPSEIQLVVMQNGRTDNMASGLQPSFVESNRLRYIHHQGLIFEGGNEYRHFDAYSVYYAGTGIDRMVYDNGDYHALLFPDDLRGIGARFAGSTITDKCGTNYMHSYDANGQYLINAEKTSDPDTEAEYVWVHWTLPAEQPWLDGAVYVGGDLFDNRLSMRNRMQYDNDARCYWLNALVKQGGYDYQYWLMGKGAQAQDKPLPQTLKSTTLQRTEGSHWQTENEYRIFVYYHPLTGRYWQLVGMKEVKN